MKSIVTRLLTLFTFILFATIANSSAQEINLGGHSATLRLNEKPSSRATTFTLPKPAAGKSWHLLMHTTSASGQMVATIKGKTTTGEEISLSTTLGVNDTKAEDSKLFYRPTNPISGSVTFEIRLAKDPNGRGPWDASVTLRAIQN